MTALTLVILVGLTAVGVGVLRPDLVDSLAARLSGDPAAMVSPSAEATPGAVLAIATEGSIPDTTVLAARLEPLVTGSALGNEVNVSVVDLATGSALYERRSGNKAVPASNMKIVTGAAMLATLGPAHQITTRAVAGPNPGEVVLVGAGDATLAVDENGFYPGAARLDDLADQVKKALGTVAPTKVITDGSLFPGAELGPGWAPDVPDEGYVSKITALMVDGARVDPGDREAPFDRHNDPEGAAGVAFAQLLGLPADAVTQGVAAAGARELGSVSSAPVLRQLEEMLGNSDNTLAETLARQVAVAKGQPASFEGAAAAVSEVVTELGIPGGLFDVADGSGYSRHNQLSPAMLTALLTKAAQPGEPIGDLFNALPVAGWSGSMDYRFEKSPAGLGVVRAKSGTLNGVNSITGVVQTAGGRLLGFAVLAENVPVWQHPAQDALDEIVAAIAQCGC